MKVVQAIEIRKVPRSPNLPKGPHSEPVMSGTVEAPTVDELKAKMKTIRELFASVGWEVNTIE